MAGGSARQTAVERALRAGRESSRVDFKAELDPSSPGAWCELVKDVAAMSNSGGGVIVVGLDDRGVPTGWDPTPLLSVDPAVVMDRMARYAPGSILDVVELSRATKAGHDVAVVTVTASTSAPIVFERPGTYDAGDGKQKTAFSVGTVYFRHGAKSEPGRAVDLERFVARELRRVRREWLANVAKVTQAPPGSQVAVHPPGEPPQIEVGQEFRVVDDPAAPAVGRTDFDRTHPYREVEVVRAVNEALGTGLVRHYDVQCVRRAYDVDHQERFFHRPKFASPQYSQTFVDWLIASYRKDPAFFADAKVRDQARRQ